VGRGGGRERWYVAEHGDTDVVDVDVSSPTLVSPGNSVGSEKEDGDWMKPMTRQHVRWRKFRGAIKRTVGRLSLTSLLGCRKVGSDSDSVVGKGRNDVGGSISVTPRSAKSHRKVTTDSNERQLARIVERHLREAKVARKEEEIVYLEKKVKGKNSGSDAGRMDTLGEGVGFEGEEVRGSEERSDELAML